MVDPVVRLADRGKPHTCITVANGLRREILCGSLPPRSRLPSIRALARELKVAPGTVKAAYAALIVEGLLVASIAGTFVNPGDEVERARWREIDLRVSALSQSLRDSGFLDREIYLAFSRIGGRVL